MTHDQLAARMEVESMVTRMFVATDERDWPAVETCFTDPFTLDMTSLVGGSPAQMSPSQVTDAWSNGLKAMDHVHHQLGNFQTVVTDQEALVRCYGTAFHHRTNVSGIKTRIFVGTYEAQLRNSAGKWLISHLKYNSKFIDGNLDLDKSL